MLTQKTKPSSLVFPATSKPTRPVLKWAGGKTQLLERLLKKVPRQFNKYIEPFVGGGALFFYLHPQQSVIADINPELINLYISLRDNVQGVINALWLYRNEESVFYGVRKIDWHDLEPCQAAARTIYLNKTCFNGLYRVNKKGQFNVPFGKYKNPNILNAEQLNLASQSLRGAVIKQGDYLSILREFAGSGDFVFLDPPYLPVGKYSDFKRYTKEQFHETDHRKLADEMNRLVNIGCTVVLTNSNHPLVEEIFRGYEIEVVPTKRHISCHGDNRRSEDVIVYKK